jgi:hypothetical protein
MEIAPVSFETQNGHLRFGAKYVLLAVSVATIATVILMEKQSSAALILGVPAALLLAFGVVWLAVLRKLSEPYRYLCIDGTGIHSWSSQTGPATNIRWEQIEAVRPAQYDEAIGLELDVKTTAPSLQRRFLRMHYSDHVAQANVVINRALELRGE